MYAQEYEAEVLSSDTKKYFVGKNLVSENRISIRINKREGDLYSTIAIPYNSMLQVSAIKGEVRNSTGEVVRKLKDKNISSVNAFSAETFYNDQMIYGFNLKHDEFPYTITYSYTSRQESYMNIGEWTPVVFQDIPTHRATLHLSIPHGMKVAFRTRNIDPVVVKESAAGKEYTWMGSYLELLHGEVLSPPLQDLAPLVSVIPEEFKYDIRGSSKSWTEFGDWIYRLNDGLQSLNPDTKEEILRSIEGMRDTTKIIETLYHWMQDETRYVFISVETGGMKPYSAGYVSTNKFGDCKALTNYFRSVLKVAHIESNYALVNAGPTISRIDMEYPSQQFNHAILMVPRGNDTLWLDCTSDGAFNFAGGFIQNRNALVIREEGGYFRKVPMLSAEDVKSTRKMVFSQVGDTVFADVSCKYRGELYELFLQMSQTARETSLRQIFRNFVVESMFELQDYNLETFHRDSAYINFSYTARSIDYYNINEDEIYIQLFPLHMPVFPPPEERELPVQIDHPIAQTDTMIYLLSTGQTLSFIPEQRVISSEYGEYRLQSSLDQNAVTITKSLLLNEGYYSPEAYDDFYAFIEEVLQSEVLQMLILSKTVEP
ncbi:MAG: DUF3857 domain-containing protein [Bacteroidota bacterium]